MSDSPKPIQDDGTLHPLVLSGRMSASGKCMASLPVFIADDNGVQRPLMVGFDLGSESRGLGRAWCCLAYGHRGSHHNPNIGSEKGIFWEGGEPDEGPLEVLERNIAWFEKL